MFKKFNEYLDAQSNLVEKPKVEKVPDYHGPNPSAPEPAVIKGKNWKSEEASSTGKPDSYKCTGEDKGQQKGEKGLADEGPKELVYKVDTNVEKGENLPGGKVMPSWKQTKTEQFINKTKDMSQKEFLDYMVEECGCGTPQDDDLPTVTSYSAGKFHPYPPEAIKYVVVLANKNSNIMDNLVHEAKRSGGLGGLIEALMNHPEAFGHIAHLLEHDEHGPSRCKSMARAMNDNYSKFLEEQSRLYESVAPPIGDEEDEEDEEEEEEEEEEEDSLEDEEMPSEDEEDLEGLDDGSEEEEGLEGEENPEDEEEFPRFNKKFAHDNMISAMGEHEPIKRAMKKFMKY